MLNIRELRLYPKSGGKLLKVFEWTASLSHLNFKIAETQMSKTNLRKAKL